MDDIPRKYSNFLSILGGIHKKFIADKNRKMTTILD